MNKWTISKEFRFDSAHSLPHLPVHHKCHHVHGHSYVMRVFCEGKTEHDHLPNNWVVDYRAIKDVVQPIIETVDHKNLNEILPMPTTAENLAQWFYHAIKPQIPQLCKVEVQETPGTCCEYTVV